MRTTLQRALRTAAVMAVLATSVSWAGPVPAEGQVETTRSSVTRAVYFPFLAVGHAVLLVVEYGIAYPVYFLAKPVYDFAYTSWEDPTELAGHHVHERPAQH